MNFIRVFIIFSAIILSATAVNYNLQGYLLRKKIQEINKGGRHLFGNATGKKFPKIRVISPIKPRKQSRNCFFSVIQCYLPKVDVFKSSDNKIYGKLRNGRTYHGSF
uniref:Uncharacterized protein n=1 Tax=Strongyloides papillosus TaxID=174720 RepID=A0A0N5BIT8_STREA